MDTVIGCDDRWAIRIYPLLRRKVSRRDVEHPHNQGTFERDLMLVKVRHGQDEAKNECSWTGKRSSLIDLAG